MVRNPKLNAVYYFIAWNDNVERCLLQKFQPKKENQLNNAEFWNDDTWYGKCLDSTGNRGFCREQLYETRKEAETVRDLNIEAEQRVFSRKINTKEKLLKLVFEHYYNDPDYKPHLKSIFSEKVKEYFNMEL